VAGAEEIESVTDGLSCRSAEALEQAFEDASNNPETKMAEKARFIRLVSIFCNSLPTVASRSADEPNAPCKKVIVNTFVSLFYKASLGLQAARRSNVRLLTGVAE
jgi:hypothetical protein